MCVAILKPHDKVVSEGTLKSCFDTNPHGAGFMYSKGGKVIVKKGYFEFPAFLEAYKEHSEGPAKDTAIAIHFRIMTAGEKNELNCHPHVVADDLAFIHNGIISGFTIANSPKSDTIHWMEDAILPLYKAFGKNLISAGRIWRMLEADIGTYNKMVFLSGGPKAFYWILNEKQGTWSDGSWFSNMSWKTYVYDASKWKNRDFTNGSGSTSDLPISLPPYQGHRGKWDRKGEKEWKKDIKEVDNEIAAREARDEYAKRQGLRSASNNGCFVPWWQNPPGSKFATGKWFPWKDYFAEWPDESGPYEWWLQGFASPDDFRDSDRIGAIPEPRPILSMREKKTGCCPESMSSAMEPTSGSTTAVADKTFECPDIEADDGMEDVITDADNNIVASAMMRTVFPEPLADRQERNQRARVLEEVFSQCRTCLKELNDDEKANDDLLCVNCFLNTQS